jgi:hypothetical protein
MGGLFVVVTPDIVAFLGALWGPPVRCRLVSWMLDFDSQINFLFNPYFPSLNITRPSFTLTIYMPLFRTLTLKGHSCAVQMVSRCI